MTDVNDSKLNLTQAINTTYQTTPAFRKDNESTSNMSSQQKKYRNKSYKNKPKKSLHTTKKKELTDYIQQSQADIRL